MATAPKAADTKSVAPTDAPETAKSAKARARDPRRLIHVYDPATGVKNPHAVPETFLDNFPNLRETPSTKEGN